MTANATNQPQKPQGRRTRPVKPLIRSRAELAALNLKQLKQHCRELSLSGCSTLRKDEIIKLIEKNQRDENAHDWISREQLAAWGLLDQVIRIEAVDTVLQEHPEPTSEEMQDYTRQWCEQNNLKNTEQVKQWIQNRGLSTKQWQALIARPKRWLNWCECNFKHRVKTHFLRHKAQFDRVTYSLIRVKDEDLAWELFHRIQCDEHSFEDLARTYSEGHERDTGGLLGPVPMSQPHPHLSELLRISQPGKMWTPKKLEGWWVIVRLESNHSARFSELHSILSLQLGEQHLKELLESKLVSSPIRRTSLPAHA